MKRRERERALLMDEELCVSEQEGMRKNEKNEKEVFFKSVRARERDQMCEHERERSVREVKTKK